MNRGHANPPAREEDIARVEQLVGCRLPGWLRNRLLVENGFVLDDSKGVTGEEWCILPVMDRADRKRMTKTAEDIAWHTARARAADKTSTLPSGGPRRHPFPAEAVMIGHAWAEDNRLMLLPDPADVPPLAGSAGCYVAAIRALAGASNRHARGIGQR